VTEIKERYETVYGTTPQGRRWLAHQEFRHALRDLVADVGATGPDGWTAERTELVNRDLTVCIAALWMFEDTCDRARKSELLARLDADDTSDSLWGIWPDE
jgi:hypothetical protein